MGLSIEINSLYKLIKNSKIYSVKNQTDLITYKDEIIKITNMVHGSDIDIWVVVMRKMLDMPPLPIQYTEKGEDQWLVSAENIVEKIL